MQTLCACKCLSLTSHLKKTQDRSSDFSVCPQLRFSDLIQRLASLYRLRGVQYQPQIWKTRNHDALLSQAIRQSNSLDLKVQTPTPSFSTQIPRALLLRESRPFGRPFRPHASTCWISDRRTIEYAVRAVRWSTLLLHARPSKVQNRLSFTRGYATSIGFESKQTLKDETPRQRS